MDKLIVIEGACDGIGKTTQYKMLHDRLAKEREIVSHHFPSYDTYQGAMVEHYLKGDYGNIKDLSPYFVAALYGIDRAITWKIELEKEYNKDKTILLDRYTTSSLMYQSAFIKDLKKKKEFIDYIIDFEYRKLQIQEPDKIIYLTAPYELVEEMRNNRKSNEGIVNDIHERDRDFMKIVYENSEFLSEYLKWDRIECSQNNKMKSIEDIHDEVYKLVKRGN